MFETERGLNLIELERNQAAAFAALAGLDLYPMALDRGMAPDDQHTFGLLEIFLDERRPVCTNRGFSVPEDGPALCFESLNDRCDAIALITLVAEEDIGHFPGTAVPDWLWGKASIMGNGRW